MNISTQDFSSWKSKATPANFIHLKEITFAEYNFIYHINDGYRINQFEKFGDKHQLLFQKISSKFQQVNLIIIDGDFSVLLSDLVLDVFLNNVSTFEDYIVSEKQLILNNLVNYREYLKYNFFNFIHYLVYSNIAKEEVCKGLVDSTKVFYFKNDKKEVEYFSIYEQNELQLLLLTKMKLVIDMEKSFIKEREANICLRIYI